MYTTINFKTKKALKEALASGAKLTYFQPGPWPVGGCDYLLGRRRADVGNDPRNGTVYLEGPHYPEAHKWYARAEVKDGYIIKVK